MSATYGIAWPSHVAWEPCGDAARWATPTPACSPSVSVRFSPPAATTVAPPGPPPAPRKGTPPAQGSSSLPTTGRRGGFPCLLRRVSPGPAGKACLASDGESGTSGPDEGCLCGQDMPELALLGVGWRRGPTQSPPLRQGCDPHPSPTPPQSTCKSTQTYATCLPTWPGPSTWRVPRILCQSLPTGGSLIAGS